MRYLELRELVKNNQKYPECILMDRSPIMHEGFPGTFNLSVTEYPWLKKYGRYTNINENFTFSMIQSCIRPTDIDKLKDQINAWKYLGVFEISDITGLVTLPKKTITPDIHITQIKDAILFLNKLGIKSADIYPSYCAGGTVATLSDNKYQFEQTIPENTIAKAAFLEAGIPEKNLIPDTTRDTFLCLHLGIPTPWGYRNEINVLHQNKMLDIGTIESLYWIPKFNGEQISANIYGLQEAPNTYAISAIGLERTIMAINNLRAISEVDHIKPLYDFNNTYTPIAIESLRALQRIHADIEHFDIIPGRHQRERMKKLYRNVLEHITRKDIPPLLEINTQYQPWHLELIKGIQPTIEGIERYHQIREG